MIFGFWKVESFRRHSFVAQKARAKWMVLWNVECRVAKITDHRSPIPDPPLFLVQSQSDCFDVIVS